MEKINIAELLKDCPKGMKLDCTMFDGVLFDGVVDDEEPDCPILIRTKEGETWNLTREGCWDDSPSAKCVIFPKGKTTWEGFVPPCVFKDGDVVAYNPEVGKTTIYIYRLHKVMNTSYYVALSAIQERLLIETNPNAALNGYNGTARLATEEEKARLFQAIKDNGYKWNAETKTLEKTTQPKFKDGDRVTRTATHEIHIIGHITSSGYVYKNEGGAGFTFEDEWLYELVSDKFDISTLKPFDKVLVRSCNYQTWTVGMFSFYCEENIHPFACVGGYVSQCIPYEENKHLLGTTDDCDEFYKTWE